MPLMGVGACVSVQFAVVEELKRRFSHVNERRIGKPDLSNGQLYMSGVGAGLANSFIASPVENVRIRMQTQQTRMYSGPIDCLAK